MSKDKYGFEQNPIQRKINTAIHKVLMSYYDVRNYRKELSHNESTYVSTWKYWELRKPLKIQYQVRTTGWHCKHCDKDHLEYRRNFERYIWSKKINYIDTDCTCEDLLFEPLEDDPSALFAGANSQWTIVEKGVLYHDK